MNFLGRTIFLLGFSGLISLSGCRKNDNILLDGNFDTRFVIPSGLNTVLTHYITIENVYTDFSRKATSLGISLEDIKKIQASYGKIRAISANHDLDFIQDISVVIISRINPERKVEMYYSEFVPFQVDQEIKLQSGASELKEILDEDFIDIEIRMNIRGFVPNAIEAVLESSYVAY